MIFFIRRFSLTTMLIMLLAAQSVQAAITLDRTRIIFNGTNSASSVRITNDNTQLPYLAQAWLEDEQGNKVTSPLVVLPPVQRIEPGEKSQVKIQALPQIADLPQDRETLFYFNLREIPPRSDKPNTLQIALQTKIKLFYRPKAIVPGRMQIESPWQQELVLRKLNKGYQLHNPTPYYITIVDARGADDASSVDGFRPVMVPPRDSLFLDFETGVLGSQPMLTYINDFGGRPVLTFNCKASECRVVSNKAG